ncbi:zinc-binding dehydrogenase [Candidatus Nitrosotenuis uzonensis]|uniref:Alcohol dehydrogenase zinc-binding domain protein n=1 Tax=Candidatus Nitrosotenuis uzonensis TaxID=1407055 RepID=A0A812EWT4_9ARCH|nr:zinc-binding dehydrogenase [Candidatus Nitrosotenuis uzonensis]MCA2003481.1 zinc-binding dehydrogenase [Candidatus Nitrosotenuis sp.]CAE6495159.1 Alcohol dehydrogenase zinc-binding domain protein [Candidatus Nitrosotenuis uzonensis]
MKALVYEQYAPDDDYAKILQIKEVPDPVPKANEVVFRVKVAGLNHDDIWGMRGKPLQIPLPHISGSDAAGEVTAVGDDVTGIKVGDRVVSHGNLSCRICMACTSGREFDCKNRKVWGFQTGPLWGGYCQYTHLPEVNVAKIPDNVSYEEAAAASMTMMTAWHMLVGRAKIRPGQTVLVMGGGSGMGIFGIQIAKLYGCDVIATASANKLEECRKIGADFAVDHRKEDWHKEVFAISKEIAKDKSTAPGIDVIFEHIGGSHWNKELTLLKYGATLVTTGATTGYEVNTDLRHIFFKGTNVLGSTLGTKYELEDGLYWMSKGKIKSIIDSIYPLEEAVQAHTKMLKGNLFGKILMRPD